MSFRSKVTLIYLLGFALDLANLFVLNSAYPAIGQALGASVHQLSWVGNAYMLGLTLVIPLGNWLAQRIGERNTLLLSLGAFGLGTAMAGLAPSIEALIGWRLLQGLGGGLLIPVGQALAYRSCSAQARAGLTSQVMTVALLVPALSPALGGWLADHGDWRWAFAGMLALTLAGVALVLQWLPKGQPLPARQPALSLGLLRQPLLRSAMLVYLCVPGVFMGVNLVAALYLQTSLGLSATASGGLMLAWALGACAAIATTRWRFNVLGPKPLLLAGMLVQSLAVLVLASPWLANHQGWLVLLYGLMGLGSSLCSSTAQTAAFVAICPARMGAASTLWNLNRQSSFFCGVALLGSLLDVLLPAPTAYAHVLVVAAVLTLVPLPWVMRLPGARTLFLQPAE
ncbi:MFS transporter [Pseudomonas aegrilactucae]|uniref:MFS transporter n=1 Tax=Pseudomonas aegrilactucae TaxID=2854028 RepID=A0A9Q2XQZ4_9PSED|nr:MFS transporter [Pseudomonas aegrilactucae]MBV6290234.1 MFS transporter [Pseudomonas aegrilactucae]